MKEFWQTCVSRLEQELPPQQISAWIRPLVPLAYDETQAVLRVAAPNRFKLDWVRKNFSHQIEALAAEWFERPVQVLFELPTQGAAPRMPVAPVRAAPAVPTHPSAASPSGGAPPPAPAAVSAPPVAAPATTAAAQAVNADAASIVYERSRLNTDLTFENFVTGKANQLARAAALQVAENPGTSYNPLFLYGGVGLGKTHLIHAIGNAMVAAGTGVRVRYVHADQYVSDVVKAYQRKAFDDFKRYYHSLDLLLIDDIQFFSGKNRTQEEFFYAFEAMVAQRKQIIITSDTYPKELSGIDSRLISRFDSGLTVAIEPPELEMRVAILLRKAESEGVPMPEEVAFFIAKHLRSNVRELEGALRKVLAYARFHGRDVLTVDVCKEALKDLLSVSNGQITVENIQKTVADFYKIKVADMYSKRRPANIALPRQVAMYLAKELTQKSLPEIGDLFGGRDHTTVLHAVRKISDARAKQAELNHTLHVLEQTLKG
ncbi:chromosomal replication initiator protein DnaA [Achromobacter insolitus]|jgi:chromosomal replication initiator protein|uniref:Chromosomal replication initiator protein DnaA n=4 Tax=Achromobacter insolitus TaxID=217204 RepID=A0A6S7F682_9BURK|nr:MULTISPECIES: chromosomal replication initiator protein DnaA [Achromobacter]AVG42134.1 chromosomal replication initiator protein DnaA [Achromobacter insolitus]AXA73802.1 chromosomal replication initiation protein DnaA [Achromobacter insolitus]MCP1400373.1 chromosomal replication initiator protein [Achromobacter insolitus]MDH3061699.1 chromosomal replication initiator protein DnaA [Achromobacter insolitus]MDQ6212505.1 chromosomal replication initiator protein DnaA [Achromobacter insolitus]